MALKAYQDSHGTDDERSLSNYLRLIENTSGVLQNTTGVFENNAYLLHEKSRLSLKPFLLTS